MITFRMFLESKARLEIEWYEPDLREEVSDYLKSSYAKESLKKYGLKFANERTLLYFLSKGKLKTINRGELTSNCKNLTSKPQDFQDAEKSNRYSMDPKQMERHLLTNGLIRLPAPIIIKVLPPKPKKGEEKDKKKEKETPLYYGLSGNKRLNLAFKHNLPVKVWLVEYQRKD